MIELAGGECLLAVPGEKAPVATPMQLAGINPDVVLVKPCGFDLQRSLADLETLKQSLPWQTWNASRNGGIFLVDGNAYFNRPGPRIIDSLEILAYCLHPGLFPEYGEKYSGSIIQLKPDFVLP